jgi:uncharacterized protein YecA (UPF0149 family)
MNKRRTRTAKVQKAIDLRNYKARIKSRAERKADVEGLAAMRKMSNPAPIRVTKTPRNALCPCGSGLKYKRCCLNKKED